MGSPRPSRFWLIRWLALATFVVDIIAGIYYINQFNNTSETCDAIYIDEIWDSSTLEFVCDQAETNQCQNTNNCFASSFWDIGYCSGCECCAIQGFFAFYIIWIVYLSLLVMRELVYMCAVASRLKRLTTMSQHGLFNLSPCFFSHWLIVAPCCSDSYAALMGGYTSGTYRPRAGYIFLDIFVHHVPSLILVVASYEVAQIFPVVFYISIVLSSYSILYKLLALRNTMKPPAVVYQQINTPIVVSPAFLPGTQYVPVHYSTAPVPGTYSPATGTYVAPYVVQGAPPPYGAPYGGAAPPPSYAQAAYGQQAAGQYGQAVAYAAYAPAYGQGGGYSHVAGATTPVAASAPPPADQ